MTVSHPPFLAAQNTHTRCGSPPGTHNRAAPASEANKQAAAASGHIALMAASPEEITGRRAEIYYVTPAGRNSPSLHANRLKIINIAFVEMALWRAIVVPGRRAL
jgi:hypothetical protein